MRRASRRVVVAILLAACASPPAATPGADQNVLFQDDFSQTTSGWDKYTASDVVTNYDDGQYLIAVEDTDVDVWARPGLDLTDVTLEVDATYAAGPVNNTFGVICRYERQGDKNSFYFFLISSDGYYSMGKVSKNERTVLNPTSGEFQPSEGVSLDLASTQRLRASCLGRRMSLAVNGTPLGEFEDDELTRGDIGLIAGTFDEGGVRIHFDNLEARKP